MNTLKKISLFIKKVLKTIEENTLIGEEVLQDNICKALMEKGYKINKEKINPSTGLPMIVGLNIDIYGMPFNENKLDKKVEFNLNQLNLSLAHSINSINIYSNPIINSNHDRIGVLDTPLNFDLTKQPIINGVKNDALSSISVNPATGISMMGHSGIDISGSPVGINIHDTSTFDHDI